MSPPVVGILMSPPTRPSMGVLIIVCAMSGPAETAKPVATLEAMNPRRENLTFGSRLLNSGLVGARSFIEFLRRGRCRWASRKANEFCQLLISAARNATSALGCAIRARAKQRLAAWRTDPVRLLNLDLSFHRRVPAADVVDEPRRQIRTGGALRLRLQLAPDLRPATEI